MAALTDEQRRSAWAAWMDDVSRRRDPCAITKHDLRAAFDAIDNFFESNKTTINQAIPEPARSGLTTSQKALLLALVLRARYDVGA